MFCSRFLPQEIVLRKRFFLDEFAVGVRLPGADDAGAVLSGVGRFGDRRFRHRGGRDGFFLLFLFLYAGAICPQRFVFEERFGERSRPAQLPVQVEFLRFVYRNRGYVEGSVDDGQQGIQLSLLRHSVYGLSHHCRLSGSRQAVNQTVYEIISTT